MRRAAIKLVTWALVALLGACGCGGGTTDRADGDAEPMLESEEEVVEIDSVEGPESASDDDTPDASWLSEEQLALPSGEVGENCTPGTRLDDDGCYGEPGTSSIPSEACTRDHARILLCRANSEGVWRYEAGDACGARELCIAELNHRYFDCQAMRGHGEDAALRSACLEVCRPGSLGCATSY